MIIRLGQIYKIKEKYGCSKLPHLCMIVKYIPLIKNYAAAIVVEQTYKNVSGYSSYYFADVKDFVKMYNLFSEPNMINIPMFSFSGRVFGLMKEYACEQIVLGLKEFILDEIGSSVEIEETVQDGKSVS